MDKTYNEHGINLNSETVQQLTQYMDLLLFWNEKINLTTITEPQQIVLKHFVDSLMLSKFENLSGKKLIDIGTGAGLPGMVLGIFESGLDVTLMDSRAKKIMFLDEVITKLNLKNVKTISARAEDFAKKTGLRESFDIAVSRAVASLPVLCEYALPYVKTGGVFAAYKSGAYNEELETAQKVIEVLGGSFERVEKFALGKNEMGRSLIFIRKLYETPQIYPRKSNTIAKKPII